MNSVQQTFKPENLDRECELFVEVADAIRDGNPLSSSVIEYLRYVGSGNYPEVKQRLPTAYNFLRNALSEEEKADLDYAYGLLNQEVCTQLKIAYTEGVKLAIRTLPRSNPTDGLQRLYDLWAEMSALGLDNCEGFEKAGSIIERAFITAGVSFQQEQYRKGGQIVKRPDNPELQEKFARVIRGQDSVDSLFESKNK